MLTKLIWEYIHQNSRGAQPPLLEQNCCSSILENIDNTPKILGVPQRYLRQILVNFFGKILAKLHWRCCNYAKILPKKFTKIWRKYRCGTPKIFGVLSMFSSILEQQFCSSRGGWAPLLFWCIYSQINLVSIKVMYLPRNWVAKNCKCPC